MVNLPIIPWEGYFACAAGQAQSPVQSSTFRSCAWKVVGSKREASRFFKPFGFQLRNSVVIVCRGEVKWRGPVGGDRLPTLAECYALRQKKITVYHSHEPTALNFIKAPGFTLRYGYSFYIIPSTPQGLLYGLWTHALARSQAAT